MPLFFPDVVLPHDPAGFGRWLIGHYLEHKQFISSAAALAIPQNVPDYAIHSWSDDPAAVSAWLNAHEQIHEALRQVAGYSGIDLASVDLSQDDQWYVWMDDHSAEHGAERQFFGLT
jgi:hypothetical protein